MATLRDKIKGVLEKKPPRPIIVIGPFTEEEQGDEIRKSIERGICPRDGHSLVGKTFCDGCGGDVAKMMEAAKRNKP
jgi:hypothetical protein